MCGNYENFDQLYNYPIEEWNGGKIHKINDSVFHLMRGQVFKIDGKSFFTFGGASSHNIPDGILEMDNPRVLRWMFDREKNVSCKSCFMVEGRTAIRRGNGRRN